MQLVAMLGDERVDATAHTRETWAELQASERRKQLTMPLCGIRAVARTRGERTRYFAHFKKAGCRVEHGGESAQHLAMKEAIAKAIDAVPGWHAVIEYPHSSREWIIDVLAESEASPVRRVAFEVQLSPQGQERYFARSNRYFAEDIFPVWVIPAPLEAHRIVVPTVVAGFGKTSPVPADPGQLLRLQASHDRVADAPSHLTLESFVRSLLSRRHAWNKGSPSEQEEILRRQDEEADAAAKAREEDEAAFESKVEEMNLSCSSPERAYGADPTTAPGQIVVFAALAPCLKCEEPMLLWWAREPKDGWRWKKVPSEPKLDVLYTADRLENDPLVRRTVEEWAAKVQADVQRAVILPHTAGPSGVEYSAFACPACQSVFAEDLLARIKDEHWSVIAAPVLTPPNASKPAPPKPKPEDAPLTRCGLCGGTTACRREVGDSGSECPRGLSPIRQPSRRLEPRRPSRSATRWRSS